MKFRYTHLLLPKQWRYTRRFLLTGRIRQAVFQLFKVYYCEGLMHLESSLNIIQTL